MSFHFRRDDTEPCERCGRRVDYEALINGFCCECFDEIEAADAAYERQLAEDETAWAAQQRGDA